MSDGSQSLVPPDVNPIPSLLAATRTALDLFFTANPDSSIDEYTNIKGVSAIRVVDPWNDESLSISVPSPIGALVDALNALILPERLSAIYHVKERELEVIFTSFALSKQIEDLRGRSFEYRYEGQTHTCRFGKSSDRLMTLALNTVPRSTSATNLRNLQSFMLAARLRDRASAEFNIDEPTSFWISNIDYHPTATIEFVENLSFYLRYFDADCPLILVHDVRRKVDKFTPRTRFPRGKFPVSIEARQLDQNLVSFWNATFFANPMLTFILYYRIMEYAAYHFLDESVRKGLKRLIGSPDFGADLSKSMEDIATTFHLKTLDDVPKFKLMVRTIIDPKTIWSEVDRNRALLSQTTEFDGGFRAGSLISGSETESTFCNGGMDKFADAIRKLRNALSHGKDIETAGVILPTAKNFLLLRPWVNLMAISAAEIILYKDLI